MDFWGYCASDIVFCWIREDGCENIAVDIHHIDGRIGNKKEDIYNLIPACRNCHDKVEARNIYKERLLKIVRTRIERYENNSNRHCK